MLQVQVARRGQDPLPSRHQSIRNGAAAGLTEAEQTSDEDEEPSDSEMPGKEVNTRDHPWQTTWMAASWSMD